ncbi:MAG: DNA-3-methyladenine glycosylase [Thermoproteota archaeon]|nr:DNA-3-methyladenine glycosylase [Thermoproteota archaeon]
MKHYSFSMIPIPPFSLELTAGYQTYFQGEVGADVFKGKVYYRLQELDGRLFLLSVRETGNVEVPQLEVTLNGEEFSESDAEQARRTVTHILATDIDLSQFYKLSSADPILTSFIKRFRGLHPPRMPTIFEGMIFAVAGQQISSTVARLIRTLIVKRYGSSIRLNEHVYYGFPSPQQILDTGINGLLEIKLSRRKAEYILGIASRAARGELELNIFKSLSDEEILETLDSLHGVGRWSAEWVLLRAMGRLNVFPAGDLALRATVSNYYFGGRKLSEEEARSFAERWSPFKTLATSYLFAGRRLSV